MAVSAGAPGWARVEARRAELDAYGGLMELTPDRDPADLLAEALTPPEWHQHAACRGRGTSDHFPGSGDDIEVAKAICARCAVTDECLAVAMADPTLQGVWGGTSDRQRRQIRRSAA